MNPNAFEGSQRWETSTKRWRLEAILGAVLFGRILFPGLWLWPHSTSLKTKETTTWRHPPHPRTATGCGHGAWVARSAPWPCCAAAHAAPRAGGAPRPAPLADASGWRGPAAHAAPPPGSWRRQRTHHPRAARHGPCETSPGVSMKRSALFFTFRAVQQSHDPS